MSCGGCNSSSGKTVVVTTSWDDGHRHDLKLAELLASRKLPGTFYVPTGTLGKPLTLSAAHLRELGSAGFEIGAHTVTHPILSDLRGAALTREVVECKQVLEEILGSGVPSFAYPKGRGNGEVAKQLKLAGYRSARGLRMLSLSCNFPPFDMPFTVQAYPHSWTNYARNLIRRGEVVALAKSFGQIRRSRNWVDLGKALFDRALLEGGAWHLVGHSWETEKIGGWSELEEMMDYVSGRDGVRYLTNGQLAQFAQSGEAPARELSGAHFGRN
jgi:peptidoglycan/xylan/chitin deacetylase (PgdA/CDA1 family)